MTNPLLAPAEPRRTRGGAGGVRPNRPGRRSEQTVWIPESLYRGAHFNDEAVTFYTKVAALDARNSYGHRGLDTDPCTASVRELATTCGMSKSAAERGLSQLNQPGPGGTAPLVSTKRRTHRGGTGRTAYRYARLVPAAEAALQIPVTACEALTPRLFRAYLHLKRATALGLPITAAEIGGELFHHTGQRAGQPLGERTGRRILLELDRLGWITLQHRAGRQGRHLVTVNDHPLHPVEGPGPQDSEPLPTGSAAQASADTHDGSGSDDHDGSLASKEDHQSSTDGVPQVVGGIRRRRGTGSRPVDNAVDQVPAAFGGRDRGLRPDGHTPRSNVYQGPGLQLSPRVWDVLEPVRHELPGIRPYLLRRIAQEIGRQLDTGTARPRLTARLTRRYASTEPPRDIGRWILGAALVRRGCGLDSCESGVIWHTGAACDVCLDNALDRQQRDQAQQQSSPPATPRDPAPGPVRPATAMVPLPPPAPARPPVLRASPAERAAATPEDIRQAVQDLGPTDAAIRYGLRLVAPYITDLDPQGLEGEARAQ